MQEPTVRLEAIDLSSIEDPHVRRALRAIHQQMTEALNRHQQEIEALVEVLLDKHLTSIGEFKRQLTRIQLKDPKHSRLHEQLNSPHPAPAAAAASAIPRPVAH